MGRVGTLAQQVYQLGVNLVYFLTPVGDIHKSVVGRLPLVVGPTQTHLKFSGEQPKR
jgi:hypothetical protein